MTCQDTQFHSRRSSLAISALLNDEPVDPIHPLPDHEMKKRYRVSWPGPSVPDQHLFNQYEFGPPRIDPEILWRHSTTGIHRTSQGLIVSAISKAKRKRISPEQYQRLMQVFAQTDTPSSDAREKLAIELDMTKREVQVWFQNRRAKKSRARVSQSTN
ncbi:homeobox domain-containing protein [Phycomyces nitens]|nr:homeobox domain-containing protein [Phycomyces nitens]